RKDLPGSRQILPRPTSTHPEKVYPSLNALEYRGQTHHQLVHDPEKDYQKLHRSIRNAAPKETTVFLCRSPEYLECEYSVVTLPLDIRIVGTGCYLCLDLAH